MPTPQPVEIRDDLPALPIYRLSVDQYHQMIEQRIFDEDDAVELLAGWVALKMPRTPLHESVIRRIRRLLEARVEPEWMVDTQTPIELADSEPEPDLSIVRPADDDYAHGHPKANDIGLLIEVAQTTLKTNRGLKLQIYAAGGIPEYWIVNLVDEQIEVYRTPSVVNGQPTYVDRQDFKAGSSVPLILGGKSYEPIPIGDVLS